MAALLPAVAAASRDLQEPRTSRKLSMKDLFGAGEGASSTYKATTALAKVGVGGREWVHDRRSADL